jgi:transposase
MSTKPKSKDTPKRYTKKRGKKLPEQLNVTNPNAAGIDLGSRGHYVSVPEDRDDEPIRRFGCFTAQLHAMAEWLMQCGITTVAMEATGVYWSPVYRVLESYGLEVILVNPRHVKYVPGRKTDVADCQWLRQLHTYGLLQGAFVPSHEVATVRTYWRQHTELIQCCTREILHMQKTFTEMNIQLHVVLSDITGVSGMKIVRAIVAGQHDPATLATLANAQVKASREQIIQALTGHYTEEGLFVLKQSLDAYDFFQQKVQECEHELERYLSHFESKADPATLPEPKRKTSRRKNQPHFDLRREMFRITGVDLTRIDGIEALTAFTLLSEIGFDVQAFPTEGQFASWLGLCPNNTITGDKVKRRRTTPNANRAATALRVGAQSLWKSKTYLGATYRRFRGRLGPAKGTTATAHTLARIAYRMLKYGEEFIDKGAEHLEKQHQERAIKALIRNARDLELLVVDPVTGETINLHNYQPLTQNVS